MTERDENDLTTEDLMAMWGEGTPVEVVTGFAPTEESKQFLKESAPTAANSGTGKTERFPGASPVLHSGRQPV